MLLLGSGASLHFWCPAGRGDRHGACLASSATAAPIAAPLITLARARARTAPTQAPAPRPRPCARAWVGVTVLALADSRNNRAPDRKGRPQLTGSSATNGLEAPIAAPLITLARARARTAPTQAPAPDRISGIRGSTCIRRPAHAPPPACPPRPRNARRRVDPLWSTRMSPARTAVVAPRDVFRLPADAGSRERGDARARPTGRSRGGGLRPPGQAVARAVIEPPGPGQCPAPTPGYARSGGARSPWRGQAVAFRRVARQDCPPRPRADAPPPGTPDSPSRPLRRARPVLAPRRHARLALATPLTCPPRPCDPRCRVTHCGQPGCPGRARLS